MSVNRPLVVQTEHLDEVAAAWLRERCELVVCPWEDSAKLDAFLPTAEGLVIRTYTKVNDALLAKAPKLRVVGRAGVGLDNVDVPACSRRGVVVVSTPGANTRAVVELVTAYMLDALRPRVFLDRALDAAGWNKARKELVASRQLSDLTLGVVGFGRVGTSVARVGAALDMRVMYHDLLEIPAERRHGAIAAPMETVCREADVLTIHVDGRASNRHLIGRGVFDHAKRDLVFINTSRGFVVDTDALAFYLRACPGAQALIDVHEPEPIASDSPLLGLKNAHLSPHIGAATKTAQINMSWVVRDVWRVLSGEVPEWAAGG